MIRFLEELRSRLFKIVIFVIATFTICCVFNTYIFEHLVRPIIFKNLSAQLVATSLTSTVMVPIKTSLYVALLFSLPFILSQAWLFINPALFKHERSSLKPILFLSVFLLFSGICFGLFVMYPITVSFLIRFAPSYINVMADISLLLDLILSLCIGAGVAFQVPLVTHVVLLLGVVNKAQLKQIRPFVIICSLVIGMLLTPPDVISQITLAIPIWLLFEVGLLFSKDKEHTSTAIRC